MLLWLKAFNDCNWDVTIHRPNISTLLSSAFIRGNDEDARQECWNVGSMNCNFSVAFIKSLNHSSIKPCLIVCLVVLNLKKISFSLPPKIPPGRRAGNFLTYRISNVRLSSGPNEGWWNYHFRFKGVTTNQSSCYIYLANCNFSFLFPPQALVCPPYFEVLITTSTWRCCFRIWTQSLSIKSVAGLWGVGTQRLTVGQHRHSTVTAMGGDPQWLSSKLTVISLVDTLTCPGPAVSKKQANISRM